MTEAPMGDEDARRLRTHWFRYLDTVEPERRELYAYCRRLTGSLWDAEDLVQDTLIKGFAMTARGDFHGPSSPVRNLRAYLFRTATNGWLDEQRRLARFVSITADGESTQDDADPVAMSDALSHASAHASPAEFASLILKEVYGFTLDEIADFIGTTTGTVKSALHRARSKVRQPPNPQHPASGSQRQLAGALADAINTGDPDRVLEIMADSLQIVVCNVGGGRGRSELWTRSTLSAGMTAETALVDGQHVILLTRGGMLQDILRPDGSEGLLTRLNDYCYAPDLLREASSLLGIPCDAAAHHQPPDVLVGMIETTTLPWRA